MYQQTRLSDLAAIGAPGPIPYCVANWSDAELADLDAMGLDPQFGLAGMGLWPVDVAVPSFDPASQALVQPTKCDSVDAAAKRWKATATVRALTADEFAAANPVPDNPTLGDWRVGLTLWGKLDDVSAKVAALVGSADPSQAILGKIATERLEYSNNVLRAQLLQLKDVFGFSGSDVDESLYRARQVSLGDLSGKWPL